MGTWHYDREELIKVLQKHIKIKDANGKIGEGLGDDERFDYIGDLEDTLDKNEIINGKIIMYLRWYKTFNRYEAPWLTERDCKEINWQKTEGNK